MYISYIHISTHHIVLRFSKPQITFEMLVFIETVGTIEYELIRNCWQGKPFSILTTIG